ncbi:hypothetical protein D3C80_1636500 [compost metagenome]
MMREIISPSSTASSTATITTTIMIMVVRPAACVYSADLVKPLVSLLANKLSIASLALAAIPDVLS